MLAKKLTGPVVIPQNIKKEGTKRLTRVDKINFGENNVNQNENIISQVENDAQTKSSVNSSYAEANEQIDDHILDSNFENSIGVSEPKRGRGRPKKANIESKNTNTQNNMSQEKRKRGRPRKIQEEELQTSNAINNENQYNNNPVLPGFEQNNGYNSAFAENRKDTVSATVLPGFDEETQEENILPGFGESGSNASNTILPSSRGMFGENIENVNDTIDLNNLLSEGRKIVSFVGTSKNGISFIVNNMAEKLSSLGVDVAVFDATKNKNSYYIYTKNEEELRKNATQCVENLKNGVADGIKANRNLTIYSSLPDSNVDLTPEVKILETLVRHHSIVLIDCDFDTPLGYFKNSQEVYLVQSMDILTIQPLTVFLDRLKAKNVLDESKLRIIVNKYVRLRGVNEKTIIGGMAYFNNPEMSIMEELFDRNIVKYIVVPFDLETYIKYLEGIVECDISIKDYPKNFKQVLDQLASMIYPVYKGKEKYVPNKSNYGSNFSPSMNDTLNKMKQKY